MQRWPPVGPAGSLRWKEELTEGEEKLECLTPKSSNSVGRNGPLRETKRRNDSRKVTATPSRQMPHTRGGGNWAGHRAPSPARLIWVERAPGGGVHLAGARVPRGPGASVLETGLR